MVSPILNLVTELEGLLDSVIAFQGGIDLKNIVSVISFIHKEALRKTHIISKKTDEDLLLASEVFREWSPNEIK